MVKHVILWTLKEMSDEEKKTVKAGIKTGLEGLKGKIPGLIEINVRTEGRLGSSHADLMLDTTFESKEALEAYSKHPEHVAVASNKVRPFTATRSCIDFEVPLNLGEIKVGYPDCCFMVGKEWFRYRTGAIIIENGCLLAITNTTSPYYYSVGGVVHMNETAEECILREVKEETGLDILKPRLVGIKQFPIEDGRYIVLLFKTESFSGQVVSSDEGEMEWVECDRLSEINTVDDLDNLLKVFNDPDLNEFQYLVDGDNWTISIK